MNYTQRMEFLLIGVVTFLCGILCYKLFSKLRSALPWRVNCWFCNTNTWVKFPERNCWTCPRCEQYNGFNKDGDYNKTLITTSPQLLKTQRSFKLSPAKNGLCKMCNINQQLKVTQLANYVPMHEKNFDEEIESYRLQLERAYKLCSPCKNNVQMKLHKEKEVLLGAKVLQARTPERKRAKEPEADKRLKKIFNRFTSVIALVILALVTMECYTAIMNDTKLSTGAIHGNEIVSNLTERVITVTKAKILTTFPFIVTYVNGLQEIIDNADFSNNFVVKYINKEIVFDNSNEAMQGMLGGVACLLQILGHILNLNDLKFAFVLDIMWTVFVLACVSQPYGGYGPLTLGLIKMLSIIVVLAVTRIMSRKVPSAIKIIESPPKRMKHLTKMSKSPVVKSEDSSSMDTDDDVSLTKFGLHNFTDSSNDNLMSSFNSGRVFSPRILDSTWKRPPMNSTFDTSFASRVSKSPSSISDTVFIKPSFDKYQQLTRDDSDSDLDESISCLCISSPKNCGRKTNSMFSLRKFTATPSFVAPVRRPLISPGKLAHGASWVAGGYWGSEAGLPSAGSRSSSQSSGFESQTSSLNHRTLFSQPPSREESVCGDQDRTVIDRFQNCNMGVYQYPVFPAMQCDGHVQLPRENPLPSSLFKLPQLSSTAR